MVAPMEYKTVSLVTGSWERVRNTPGYSDILGPKLFARFFTLEPDAMVVLGFPADMDPTSKVVQESPRFKVHSKYFVELLDRAIDMLGPANDVLTDILAELGQDHAKFGVKPQFFPALGVALLELLGENLPANVFTDDVKAAWVEVYTALSSDMIRALTKANSQ